jgi:hypothetical protein
LALLFIALAVGQAQAADTVPTDIQMPGTQPNEIGNVQTADKCDNHAGRDPLFWATVAVAEQDFDGAGDLCIRCHSPSGWLEGRSTPTDGSNLSAHNADGVECDYCHRMTNPDDSEHWGVQNPPFIANDGGTPATGYYGSGQYVIWNGNSKLGPYFDAEAKHQTLPSLFHRSSDLCGTCHDVSNPLTGDLAHNNGAQVPLAPGSFSGVPGGPVEDKAAFNNFPYQYGVVERTFSEHKASALSDTLVSAYGTLPAELQAGAIQAAYEAALVAGNNGDYEDGAPRYFTCQTCHMRPVTGQGCNKRPRTRPDLPLHDLTGGNYWIPDAIQYLDARGKLVLGGGLAPEQIAGMNDGKLRAKQNLNDAAALSVTGDTVRIVNLTGHKLLSGYPEGRRMWLNIKWYGGSTSSGTVEATPSSARTANTALSVSPLTGCRLKASSTLRAPTPRSTRPTAPSPRNGPTNS